MQAIAPVLKERGVGNMAKAEEVLETRHHEVGLQPPIEKTSYRLDFYLLIVPPIQVKAAISVKKDRRIENIEPPR